ncbi:MAG: Zn-ribbon domain-containing OB-fold protein [Candidatus Helarchaeota archaeon]
MTNLKEEDYINQIDNEDKADYLEYYDEMTIHYRYSVGELSKFFKEIRDNEKLFGTRCTKCGFGFFPPRLNCHKCYVPCEWVELCGKGEIIAGTLAHFGVSQFTSVVPITIAFIKMDEMDMAIRHTIVMDPKDLSIANLKKETRVKVVFKPKDQREGKITDFYFILDK